MLWQEKSRIGYRALAKYFENSLKAVTDRISTTTYTRPTKTNANSKQPDYSDDIEIKLSENNKASGKDGIVPELFKSVAPKPQNYQTDY